ncbi:MAG: MotA/TolQ/ExbB proton channel family protein [Hydrogenophaga sp.]|nr:MotA/TolQ/ExbB proton channel family protein [Hydrogenophaga sp.]
MNAIESFLFEISKFFLTPVLVLLCLMFVYALFSLGQVSVDLLARTRRPHGLRPLHRYWQRHAHLGEDGLELHVLKQLEVQRIVSRVAPMLGLVATMIPMGPALVAVAAGNTKGMAENLVVAFAAVIVALLAAAITFVVQTVRRRWLMEELNALLLALPASSAALAGDGSHV